MWHASHHNPIAPIFWHIGRYIRPTGDPGSPRFPPGVQETSTSYTVDEDYQASLDIVAAMFSRLPSDWQARYCEEVGDKTLKSYTALSSVIKAITVDMGIEVEDS